MANKPNNLKPSDFSEFCLRTYDASATLMDFEDWAEVYNEVLRLIWWNPEVDTVIAIERGADGR
ncbi:hypothetical protein [Methylomonas sp. HYX-M1]|uniref:hypothetical protein n=1 Tax=Methylomonas sp. HYX-M1 TaxID=3139307 RepID=UPI00345BBC9E